MGSNLLNGDLMGLAPLHADSGIQIVQLARAQRDGLKDIAHVYICSKWKFSFLNCYLILVLVCFLDLKLFQLLQ